MSLSLADSNVLTGPHPIVSPGPTPRQLDKHFDFLEWSTDGETLLLGSSDLTSRSWGGSVWLFSFTESAHADEPSGWRPSADRCVVGAAIDCGVTAGRFLDSPRKFVIGCDSGALQVLASHDVTSLSSDSNEPRSKVKLLGQGSLCEHNDSVSALDGLGSGSTEVVSGSRDKSIKVWDLECLVSKLTYSPAHTHMVTSVSAHRSDSNIFASCALDCCALLWDVRNPTPASGLLKLSGIGLTSLAWANDTMLAIGAVNGQISFVDIRNSSEPQAIVQLGKRPLHALCSMPGNSSIIGACEDNSCVKVVHLSSGCPPQTIYSSDSHGDFVRGLSWHPKKLSLWTCGWDSKIFAHHLGESFTVNGST